MKQEILLELPFNDLNSYYTGTYMKMKVPGVGAKGWRKINGFGGPAGTHPTTKGKNLTVESIAGGVTVSYPLKDTKWDFEIPEAGAYNYKNGVVLFSRVPIRNTSKGLNHQTARFQTLLFPLRVAGIIPASLFDANSFALTTENLDLLFDSTQPVSFSRGIERVARKQVFAHALNSRISVSQGVMSKHPCIWVKNMIVGELDLQRARVLPIHDTFSPEMSQLFTEQGFAVSQ